MEGTVRADALGRHPARRSSRVVIHTAVTLAVGDSCLLSARTAVVNRHGALILSPVLFPESTIIWIRHDQSQSWVRTRVSWMGPQDVSGLHKLGIEFVDPAPHFWGPGYESLVSAAAA